MTTAEQRMELRVGQLVSRVCVLEAQVERQDEELAARDARIADLESQITKKASSARKRAGASTR